VAAIERAPRLRVTLVSHAYLEPRYRAKLERMARRVDLELVTPNSFQSPYGTVAAAFPADANYRVRRLTARYPMGVRTSTRWFLTPWDLGLRGSRPAILDVENEQHSFILLQAAIDRMLFARRSKLVVFVWANLPLVGWRAWLLNPIGWFMRRAVDLFLVGNVDAQRLLEEHGVSPERIRLVPQIGLDVDLYRPPSASERIAQRHSLGIGDSEFVVGYVGRMAREKGVEDLVSALRMATTPMRMLAVGDGPLRGLLDSVPNAIVVAPGDASAVLPYYHAMDALVLPSRTTSAWKEQFGRVLIEAMACGVPVIGSSSGAIPEVISDAGFVFPEGDVTALTGIIESLSKEPLLSQQTAVAGRRRAVETYSANEIAKRTIEAYLSLVPDTTEPSGIGDHR
jgi:glycosyltransferase involved in cell wall biosynthesis